ncbi:MAG TPA: hypothetical protein VJN63_11645 [Thermoplasmata archaeon]|nr:hypothetical protein [Thermoplasmata archaeon]
MSILGVIPARAGSERFPRKHHAPVLTRPLISYTLEAMAEAGTLSRRVLSTDDRDLDPLAWKYGFDVIPRPPDLATNAASLDDAVRHVCRTLADRDGFEPETVVVAQGNVPVRKAGQIDEAVNRLHSLPEATAVCTARRMRSRPEWAKIVNDETTGEVVPFLPGSYPFRKQDLPHLVALDGAVLAVRTKTLFDTERNRAAHAWLGPRLHVLIQDHPMYSLEVDYPDEVPLAEFYLLQRARGEHWYLDDGPRH